MEVKKIPFGKTVKGEDTCLYIFRIGNMEVSITNYGCTITSIKTPDKYGSLKDIVLGFNTVEDYQSKQYLERCHYFGCVVGRVCNRIDNGIFYLDIKKYTLAVNDGNRHLHGGIEGFDKKVWASRIIETENQIGVELSYLSEDMEEGYPGNLSVTVKYLLSESNELLIEYFATTDKKTIINLTNHTYFNLTGGKENILNHFLEVNSTKYTELDNLIPTGRILSVLGTPYDFQEKTEIGLNINELKGGYDINYVLPRSPNGVCQFAGCLSEVNSGRYVKVYTTQPALQIYDGYNIPQLIINGEKRFGKHSGFALETQHFPDSINHSEFPSTVLSPEEIFHEITIYKFGFKS